MRSALVLEVRECRERERVHVFECVCDRECGRVSLAHIPKFSNTSHVTLSAISFCTKKYQPSPESDGIVTKPIDNEGAKASSQSLGKRGLGI